MATKVILKWLGWWFVIGWLGLAPIRLIAIVAGGLGGLLITELLFVAVTVWIIVKAVKDYRRRKATAGGGL